MGRRQDNEAVSCVKIEKDQSECSDWELVDAWRFMNHGYDLCPLLLSRVIGRRREIIPRF